MTAATPHPPRPLLVRLRDGLGWTRATALPTAIYLVVAAGALAQLALSVEVVPALRLVATLVLLGTLPGAALVRQMFRQPTFLHYLVFGTTLGLAVWSMGGMLSHLTGLVPLRFLPIVAAFVVWFVPRRPTALGVATRRATPIHGILGATLALVAMLPALRTAVITQPTQWTGWFQFYGDVPFQAAVASEVAARAPEQFPWVSETSLSYPWLFHGAAGVWASGSGTTAVDVVLQAWPILFVILIPLLIAFAGWEITRNRWVAFAAPLIYVFAHGLVMTEGLVDQTPLYQISPTRDFANLFVVLVVLCLAKLLQRRSLRATNPWWYLALGIASFAAAGSKGSALPILLAGVLAGLFVLIVMRRFRWSDLLAAGVFGVTSLIAFVLVLPERGVNDTVVWGPMTFIPPQTPLRVLSCLAIAGLLIVSIVGLWIAIGRHRRNTWVIGSLVLGVCLSGVLGLSLLTHPGYSQLYFWQNAQPMLAIATAWALVLLVQRYGRRLVFALFAMFLLANAVWMITHRIWLAAVAIAVGAAVAGIVLGVIRRDDGAERGRSRWLAALAIAGAVIQAGQLVSIPVGTSGGNVAGSADIGAFEATQRDALDYIRTHSAPDDIIATNKHCLTGTLDAGDCDGKWFAVAAWSERRVLVAGWVYTQHGTDPTWVQDRIDLSDDAIESPTPAEIDELKADGVDWIYVDTREPFSDDLADFGDLVYTSDWARVYRLD